MARRKRHSIRTMRRGMEKVRKEADKAGLPEGDATTVATSTSYRPEGKRKGFRPSKGAQKRKEGKRKSKKRK